MFLKTFLTCLYQLRSFITATFKNIYPILTIKRIYFLNILYVIIRRTNRLVLIYFWDRNFGNLRSLFENKSFFILNWRSQARETLSIKISLCYSLWKRKYILLWGSIEHFAVENIYTYTFKVYFEFQFFLWYTVYL